MQAKYCDTGEVCTRMAMKKESMGAGTSGVRHGNVCRGAVRRRNGTDGHGKK